MKRLALAILVLLLWLPRTARAARIPEEDLASDVYAATHIVAARQVAEKKINDYLTVRTMVVTKSYKGDLAPNAKFTIDYGLWSFETMDEMWNGKLDGGPPPDLSPEIIFFMLRPKPNPYRDSPSEFSPVDLRIFRGGKAQRFVQMSNPGGLSPAPQGIDPWDLCNDPRAVRPIDLPLFESMLDATQARVNAIQAAIAAPDTPESRKALARMAGAADDIGEERGCYDDRVAEAIVDALAKREDTAAVLDAVARSHVVRYSWMKPGRDSELFAIAKDTRWPIASRVAAVRVLAESSSFSFREMPTAEALTLALFDDPSPRVRAAAYTIRPTEKATPAYLASLKKHWATEKDDRVRIAIAQAASRSENRTLVHTPGVGWPLVAAYVVTDKIIVPYFDVDEAVRVGSLGNLHVTAKRGGETRLADLPITSNLWTGQAEGIISAPLDFRPPLAAGKWNAVVEIFLNDESDHRKKIERTIDLGVIEAPAPLPFSEGVAVAAAPPPSVSAPFGPPSPERPRRSCGCGAVGVDARGLDAPATSSMGILAAMLALALRRRSARCSHLDHA